jgi:pimeloyl-ACP methyl ester carboxylesterase
MQRKIETNNINMHITEEGEGPLVVLCHGFPESSYSWRHQLRALAEAGFHAVAPDQRGYGKTDKPEEIEAYNIFQLTGDIVGLVHALGEETAVIVGHDWGAPVCWHCSLLRPDMFRACILISVPYGPRTLENIPPTELMKMMAGDQQEHYVVYFQEPGKAEADLGSDVGKAMRGLLYSLSGGIPLEHRWTPLNNKSSKLIDTLHIPETLPDWLTQADLDFFTREFAGSGFRGGLNWYRNTDWNWAQTAFLNNAKITQPGLFIAGEHDMVIGMTQMNYENLETNMPNLTQKVLIPGAGHWVQQEKPDQVNELMIQFLNSLG